MRLRARGGDRQEAPAAAATARKPMPPYSEWPDEALKKAHRNTDTLAN
jgi:hypothetical protein